ncbi:MAG: FHA domain-containing protein [Fuerstiella sp.]
MFVCFDEVHGFSEGFCLAPEQLPATFGRAGDVTIRLTNLLVSRRHCQIAVKNDQLVVRDLSSLNGTLLNGEPIDEAPLFSGDTLQVGLQSFLVRCSQTLPLEPHHVKTAEDTLEAVTI